MMLVKGVMVVCFPNHQSTNPELEKLSKLRSEKLGYQKSSSIIIVLIWLRELQLPSYRAFLGGLLDCPKAPISIALDPL